VGSKPSKQYKKKKKTIEEINIVIKPFYKWKILHQHWSFSSPLKNLMRQSILNFVFDFS